VFGKIRTSERKECPNQSNLSLCRGRVRHAEARSQCDNQADYDQITSPTAAHVQQAMWSGMLAAAEKVFGGTDRLIMCMSHNERMMNGPGGLDVDRPPGNLVFRWVHTSICCCAIIRERELMWSPVTRTTSI
jgi:hypothetical protein